VHGHEASPPSRGGARGLRWCQRRAATASPTSLVRRGEPSRADRSASTAASMRAAASACPRWASRSAVEGVAAVGAATWGPARAPLEGVAEDGVAAERGVEGDRRGDLRGRAGAHGPAVADVEALGALPDDDEVDLALAQDRVGEGRDRAGEEAGGTQVDVVVE